MTDLELAAKKLSEIETFVAELRTLARPDLVSADLKERRFVEHTLQLAIQAALDLASHIVSDERWGEPETYSELFSLLRRTVSFRRSSLRVCAEWRASETSWFTLMPS